MSDPSLIGMPNPALNNEYILTGRARYVNDLSMPRMLIGRLLYSQHPVARILELDVSAARAVPGVVAVITHADIPGENSYLYAEPDQPLLAVDRVNYQGDALVALAAEDEASAQAGLSAVKVVYEPLVGIFDPVDAMQENAPQALPGYENIFAHAEFDLGDLETGFATAEVIIENEYRTQLIEHAYLEPEGALAYLDPEGMMVVYASNQSPHRDRPQIARALGISENSVRVITPYVGGAFGAKDEAHVQIHAALLAQTTGRPVKIIRSREESILTHVKRIPIIVRHKLGASSDGRLTAVHVVLIGDTGPYVNAGHFILGFGTSMASGPYYVQNARLEGFTVRTNNPIGGAMRGFGAPQVCMAYEAQMDALARKLDLDPLEIRRRNAIKSGQMVPAGGAVREAGGMLASLEEAARRAGWATRHELEHQPEPHLRRGWGIGSTWFVIGLGRGKDNAGALVEMAMDGSVIVRTGAVEMGQGVFTVLGILAAETLGVSIDDVRVVGPDTDSVVDAGPSVASRQTFVSGNAVLRAAQVIRQSLLETAAEDTGFPIDLLNLRGGQLIAEGEKLSVSVEELARKAYWANRRMHADGFYAMEYPHEFSDRGEHFGVGPSSFGTQIAQVLIDIETGEVRIEKLWMVHNVGRIINYGGAYGQMTGAAAMGTGYALHEDLLVREGRTLNLSLESFLIPTSMDVPETEVKLLEIPEPFGPLGAGGLGEPSLTPTAPAIVNAVVDAIGVPLRQLPLTPERVLAALQSKIDEG